jgi:hypothetical protein
VNAVQIRSEPEKYMNDGPAVDTSVGQENMGWGRVDLASRCGIPFRGNGKPVLGVGSLPLLSASRLAAGILVKVTWSRDVSWRKRILNSKP